MTTALTRQQQTDLRACEQVISKGINTFRDVGKALAKIRDDKLYKSEYKTFEAYCDTRWGFGKAYAYRLIEASDTPETSPTGRQIETERQARKYLDEKKQAERKLEPTPAAKPAVAEFDFDDEHHPVADESDDDQDADGGAEPVTSGPLAEMETDPVGVVEPVELDRVKFAKVRFGFAWEEYEAAFGDDAAWCYFSAAWEQFKESAGYE